MSDERGRDDAGGLVDQVARLFFERQLTKVEIAARLGISRFRVARLLERALAEGIVRIEFRGTPSQDRELGRRVAETFAIGRCVVAVSDDAAAVARLGAEVVDGLLEPGDAIGIAWGSTVARVVRAMPGRDDETIEVVQLAGSSASLDAAEDPGDLTRVLADRLGARHHRIHAPAFVESVELRAALVRQPGVVDAVSRFDDLDLALLGIGAFGAAEDRPSSSLLRSGAITPDAAAGLTEAGAVGDLIVHAFTADGAFVGGDLADRSIAISVEQLRSVPTVVAVAAGRSKVGAIRGALRTGVVGALVTDAVTARGLLVAPTAAAGAGRRSGTGRKPARPAKRTPAERPGR